jgi:hypothetical protein
MRHAVVGALSALLATAFPAREGRSTWVVPGTAGVGPVPSTWDPQSPVPK